MTKGALICILCLAVFLQILGAPVTFSNLEGLDDPFVQSILIGLAILCAPSSSSSESSFSTLVQRLEQLYSPVYVSIFFRPPLLSA